MTTKDWPLNFTHVYSEPDTQRSSSNVFNIAAHINCLASFLKDKDEVRDRVKIDIKFNVPK